MKTEKTIHRRGERKTTVTIKPQTHRKLKKRAADLGVGLSHLGEQYISDGLKQSAKTKKAAA